MTVTPLIRKLWILNSNPDFSGSRNPAFGFDPCHCAFILPSSSICQLNLIHLTSEFQWGYHSWHPHVFVKVMPSSKTKHRSGLTQSNIFCSYKSQCGQCLRREGWCFFSYVIIQGAKLMELWHHYTIGGEKKSHGIFLLARSRSSTHYLHWHWTTSPKSHCPTVKQSTLRNVLSDLPALSNGREHESLMGTNHIYHMFSRLLPAYPEPEHTIPSHGGKSSVLFTDWI